MAKTHPLLKLDVNDSGAWKSVVTFNSIDRLAVQGAAHMIAVAAKHRVKFRITDEQGKVLGYCCRDKANESVRAWAAA